MMEEKKVWVVGHKNPDTDSICAAISYAYLKNRTEKKRYEAKRAGTINGETRYVLDYFGVEEPELVTYAGAQIKDVTIRKTEGVSSRISLKRAWELMKKLEVVTLPVTNETGKLEGIIVTNDIATSYMDVLDNRALSQARTQYKTIAETLEGSVSVGNEHAFFMRGKVIVATFDPDDMAEHLEADDLVIFGDSNEAAQLLAIRSGASCIIIGSGLLVSEKVKELATKKECVVITSPFDTFAVARLINQSMPIKHYMTKQDLVSFGQEDYIDDVRETMLRIRHRDFPVLNENGVYEGMISRRNLMMMQKKQIILVDHNEKSQAVDGIDEAEILEIIDHHRLGSLETVSPVYFRNQPLGCTSTIIYQMYKEKDVEIPGQIAGLLLSAIISDTLMFRSPTCTAVDKAVAEELAELADVEIEPYAKEMFRAGSNFKNKTPEEIFYQDFKIFHMEDIDFGVAQISAMSSEELSELKGQLQPYLAQVLRDKKLTMVYVMLTDILEETSLVIFGGSNAGRVLSGAFRKREDADGILLDGVISRKKQLIPTLMNYMTENNE